MWHWFQYNKQKMQQITTVKICSKTYKIFVYYLLQLISTKSLFILIYLLLNYNLILQLYCLVSSPMDIKKRDLKYKNI